MVNSPWDRDGEEENAGKGAKRRKNAEKKSKEIEINSLGNVGGGAGAETAAAGSDLDFYAIASNEN